MKHLLICSLLLFKYTFPSNYNPCKTDIVLSIDSSSISMNNKQFEKEIEIIKFNITSDWNHYERIALLWYSDSPNIFFTFDTIISRNDFLDDMEFIEGEGQNQESNLKDLLNSLVSLQRDNTSPLSIFIFVSTFDRNDINSCIESANILLQKGSLNFILLGKNVDKDIISLMKPSNIIEWNFKDNTIGDINNFFMNSMNCSKDDSFTTMKFSTTLNVSSTIPPTTLIYSSTETSSKLPTSETTHKNLTINSHSSTILTTQNILSSSSSTKLGSQKITTTKSNISTKMTTHKISTTTSHTSTIYRLYESVIIYTFLFISIKNADSCQHSLGLCYGNTVFVLDASSDGLNTDSFEKEISFVKNSISTRISDYTRILLSWYNQESSFSAKYFGYFNESNSFDNALDTIELKPGSDLNSMLGYVGDCVKNFNSVKTSTFVFVSTLNNNNIEILKTNANYLKNKGSLNFIILGNVIEITDLLPLSPTSVIVWDFSDETRESIINFILDKMICVNPCSFPTTSTQITPNVSLTPTTSSVTLTPTTPIVTITPTSTVTFSSTATYIPVTSDPEVPYNPCESDIIFSLVMSKNDFTVEQLISQKIIFDDDNILKPEYTHYERFGFVSYSETPIVVVPLYKYTNRTTIQQQLNSNLTPQNGNNFTSLINSLSSDSFLEFLPNKEQKHYIFLDNLSIDDVISSKIAIKNLMKRASVYLISFNSLINTNIITTFGATNTYVWDTTDTKNEGLINFITSTINMC
uniref:VWFA domain-containing protein n=1 Tax=Parastrongyloides trichosuri TaxID=131310 RepID=A0A0N4ZA64_PARTI